VVTQVSEEVPQVYFSGSHSCAHVDIVFQISCSVLGSIHVKQPPGFCQCFDGQVEVLHVRYAHEVFCCA